MSHDNKEQELDLDVCPVNADDCPWLNELTRLRSENAALRLLVSNDTLTGLYNFRYFRENLSREMERTHRAGRPTSIIMIDLDFFKSINDKWGHEGGNQALIMAAGVFKQTVRLSDVVCRYGGEEFVIILPETPLPMATIVAERVRVALEKMPVEFEGETFHLTASLGVGVFTKDNQSTLESFVGSVDQYLYKAKQQGRNQVCHADYSTVQSETSVSAEEKSALFGNNPDT